MSLKTIFFLIYFKLFRVHVCTVIANANKCKAGGCWHTPNNLNWMTATAMNTVSKLHSPSTETLFDVNMSLAGHLALENSHSNATFYHCHFYTDWGANSSNTTKAKRDCGQRHSYSLTRIWNHPLPPTHRGKVTKAHYQCILQHLCKDLIIFIAWNILWRLRINTFVGKIK